MPMDLSDFPNIFETLPRPDTIGFIALKAIIPPSITGIILAIIFAFSIKASPNLPSDGIFVPKASVIACPICFTTSGNSLIKVFAMLGSDLISPFINAVAAFNNGGSNSSTSPGNSASMYGVNAVINFPTPSKPFLIAGITLSPKVLALSTR